MTERERGPGRAPAPPRPSFLVHDPVELRFGTSGLRGLVRDITDLEAVVNTRGFLLYLREASLLGEGETIELGGDLRKSTERILRAVAYAVLAEGHHFAYLGRLPTPALTLHALGRGRASIMITGSHIPSDRNGIKFNRPDGEVLKEDEAGILAAVARVRGRIYEQPESALVFDERGALREAPGLGPVDGSGMLEYRRRYREAFGESALAGARIVVYQQSAVGRDLIVELLGELGAEPVPVGRSETFEPIDTENVTPERAAFFAELARRHPGAAAIVSTDGDGDRPLLADETGRVRRGDGLGALVARLLGARWAAAPVSVNDAVDRYLAAEGIPLQKTKIGSPYVISAMSRAVEEGYAGVVGWEANGGFLTATELRTGEGRLEPLPTRDAILPLVALLSAACREGRTVSELFERLPRRFSRSGLLDDFPPEASRLVLRHFSPGLPTGLHEVEFAGEGPRMGPRGGDPPSPVREGELREALEDCRRRLEAVFTGGEGFAAIVSINLIDGLRLGFAGGDIAHIRPSGNAPQLRIYSVSDSPERAEEIVRFGLSEPDGFLRRLEREARAGAPGSGLQED